MNNHVATAKKNVNATNNNTKPDEYIHHCRQLLLDHERCWIEYQNQLIPNLNNNNDTNKNRNNSQLINWNGTQYDCAKNKCNGNCLWDATKPHQKCKCRSLYLPAQDHLIAPCDSEGKEGPRLTYSECKKLGYLDDDGDTNENTNKKIRTHPQPNWPAITCDHCKESFEALQRNFNSYNYGQVQKCINALENPDPSSVDGVSSTNTNQQQVRSSANWYAAGIILLILLTSFIAYKLTTHALCHQHEQNKQTKQSCPPCNNNRTTFQADVNRNV